ncbi:hypothetical protein DPEC_G00154040 [Dallia pectoralis]|uniref:Uncharacterized protein n=1 Tax=Dallia pectoralis TaxID=75939 RepID=A0ACC2GKI9_DALPE|nr:hypothetical protein DPEC_G00154040 [Dallia pectoralis]
MYSTCTFDSVVIYLFFLRHYFNGTISVFQPHGPEFGKGRSVQTQKACMICLWNWTTLLTMTTERFAGTDDDIRFFTRFASHAHLMLFWKQIQSQPTTRSYGGQELKV